MKTGDVVLCITDSTWGCIRKKYYVIEENKGYSVKITVALSEGQEKNPFYHHKKHFIQISSHN